MINITSSFKTRLNDALRFRKKKPADLARGTNIPQSLISQYRNGTAAPKTDKLARIASYLAVNPSWLLGFNVPIELCLSSGSGGCVKIIYSDQKDNKDPFDFSSREIEIIRRYRIADAIDKRCINRILGLEKYSSLSKNL